MKSLESLTVECQDESQTHRLGVLLGQCLQPGTVVALSGNLGAGKTRFVRAAAHGLGVTSATVNSPTFVLIHEYQGRVPVYHFDTYRLKDIDEFHELGADEYMHGDGVCFIEWAERVAEALPRDRLEISIRTLGETVRSFDFQALGPKSANMLKSLKTKRGEDE